MKTSCLLHMRTAKARISGFFAAVDVKYSGISARVEWISKDCS